MKAPEDLAAQTVEKSREQLLEMLKRSDERQDIVSKTESVEPPPVPAAPPIFIPVTPMKLAAEGPWLSRIPTPREALLAHFKLAVEFTRGCVVSILQVAAFYTYFLIVGPDKRADLILAGIAVGFIILIPIVICIGIGGGLEAINDCKTIRGILGSGRPLTTEDYRFLFPDGCPKCGVRLRIQRDHICGGHGEYGYEEHTESAWRCPVCAHRWGGWDVPDSAPELPVERVVLLQFPDIELPGFPDAPPGASTRAAEKSEDEYGEAALRG